jgi:hypothetical protein
MLDRSHRRLEQRLAELTGAATTYRSDSSGSALVAARDVCDFLQRAAARHERDEERSVFPRLTGADDLIAALTAEHRRHESAIAELAAILGADPVDGGALARAAAGLERLYRDHLDREEAELMPRVRDLEPTAREAIYAEMQARRGR